MPLNARILFRCFLRTYTVGAAFNTRGMQNIGLAHAMEPGLATLYPLLAARREARRRYIRHYNTHPFWTPLLVGTFLSLESNIAAGTLSPQVLLHIKDTTTYTLSALGDSFFSGSILVSWVLATCCLLAAGMPHSAVVLGATLFAMLQLFKLCSFIAGLREGLQILVRLKRWDLINWAERLKAVNAILAGIFLWQVFPARDEPTAWTAACAALAVLAVLVARFHVSRVLLLYTLVALILALPFID